MDIDSKEFIKLHKNATITIPRAIFTSCDRYCYAVIDLFLEKKSIQSMFNNVKGHEK